MSKPGGIRGIRQSIPAGLIGRFGSGTGAAQVLSGAALTKLLKAQFVKASGGGGASTVFADPTAVAKDTAVNGTATTAMRSDAAPAIQKTSSSLFGLAKVDGTTITATGGVLSAVSSGGYVPGTVPSVVQVAHSVGGGNSATFSVAPTNGNLLVAMCFNPTSNTAGPGWTRRFTDSGGTDFSVLLTKVAGAGESTTQTPLSGVSTTGCMMIWELHGQGSAVPLFMQSQSELSSVTTNVAPSPAVNSAVLLPNVVNCLGLSAVGVAVITGTPTISKAANIGTQDVLDNTNATRLLAAGHTDLSQTPFAGLMVNTTTVANYKGITALFTS